MNPLVVWLECEFFHHLLVPCGTIKIYISTSFITPLRSPQIDPSTKIYSNLKWCNFLKPWFEDYFISQPFTWYNHEILTLMSLKFHLMVAWYVLFPMSWVFLNFYIPTGNGYNFPTLCWFLDFWGERTCTMCHMSLFSPQILKIVPDQLQYILYSMK